LYFKPYTCCRWAQPSIEAMKNLLSTRDIRPQSIESITIHTFEESSKLLKRYPANTEEAQYNLFFPLASFLINGDVGPNEVLDELDNPAIRSLMDRMEVRVDPEIDAKFPGKALSRLEVRLVGGDTMRSATMQARGDYDFPLTGEEKKEKFFRLAQPVVGRALAAQLHDRVRQLTQLDDIGVLTALLRRESNAPANEPTTRDGKHNMR